MWWVMIDKWLKELEVAILSIRYITNNLEFFYFQPFVLMNQECKKDSEN